MFHSATSHCLQLDTVFSGGFNNSTLFTSRHIANVIGKNTSASFFRQLTLNTQSPTNAFITHSHGDWWPGYYRQTSSVQFVHLQYLPFDGIKMLVHIWLLPRAITANQWVTLCGHKFSRHSKLYRAFWHQNPFLAPEPENWAPFTLRPATGHGLSADEEMFVVGSGYSTNLFRLEGSSGRGCRDLTQATQMIRKEKKSHFYAD